MRSLRKPPKRLLRPRKPAAAVAGLATGQAMATWDRDMRPSSVLAVCTRVGDAKYVPPGYLTADCDQCGRAVWISPEVKAMAERLEMRLVATCARCLAPSP